MRGLLLAVGVLVFLGACTASSPRRSTISDEELLSGKALDPTFAVSIPVISMDDAFSLDGEMQEFVRGLFRSDYQKEAEEINACRAVSRASGRASGAPGSRWSR